jgi:hypothetical protein
VLRTLAARLFDDVNYYLGGPMASPSWIEAGHRARPAPFVSREVGERSVVWLAGERLRSAAAAQGAVIIDAFIGHADPADHFRSVVLPQLVAARAARTNDHR